MSLLLFANLASSTLAGPITSTATTVNLAAGTGVKFPSPGSGQYFLMTFTDAATGLINEIVQVTNVTGDTLTIVRGQEGTTAVAWSAGDNAQNLWTAGSAATMIQRAQLQQQADNYCVGGGSANAITATLPFSPSSLSAMVGMPIRVLIPSTNTGQATLNVNGTGAVNITTADGTGTFVGMLVAGGVYAFIYNGTNYVVQTLCTIPARFAAVDTGSVNALVATVSGSQFSTLANFQYQPLTLRVANTNTGAATLNVNGLGAIGITDAAGNSVAASQLVAGGLYTVVYNGANWILQGIGINPIYQPHGILAFSQYGGVTSVTVPAYVFKVRVRGWGAGGGGAGSSSSGPGQGGGGGGYFESWSVVAPGNTLIFSVGAPGAAGAIGAAGGGGGLTQFGTWVAGGGGGGNVFGGSYTAFGGTVSGGPAIAIPGAGAGTGFQYQAGIGYWAGGQGGGAFGMPSVSGINTGTPGAAASLFGAGGNGAGSNNYTGGAGASGLIIIDY